MAVDNVSIQKDLGFTVPEYMCGTIKPDEGRFLAEVIKQKRPAHVVETGSGLSTLYILKALKENGGGQLTSIDKFKFDEGDYVPKKDNDYSNRADYLIPLVKEHFPDAAWNFVMNRYSQDVLSDFEQPIDFFFHDSDHSLENVKREWELVKDKTKIFAAHNCLSPELRGFFLSYGFCRFWRLRDVVRVLGIWEKNPTGILNFLYYNHRHRIRRFCDQKLFARCS